MSNELLEKIQGMLGELDPNSLAALLEDMKNSQAKVTSKKKRGRPKKTEVVQEITQQKTVRPGKFGGGPNKFVDKKVDALADLKMVPKDLNFDALAENKRSPIKLVKVKCARCGKEEEIFPDAAPKRLDKDYVMDYTCNKCCRIRR